MTLIADLIGQTFIKIDVDKEIDIITFYVKNGISFRMYHPQDCCEKVYIADICGDIDDLLNSPIIKASEDTNSDNPKNEDTSFTWTFYNISTIKGSVTIWWYGESNGDYSEKVNIEKCAYLA